MSRHESDSLGTRMKGYEVAARTTLPNRLPVIIRVDGKAFHTYTRGCNRPFDERLSDVMVATAKELCKEIQGAQVAYTQSDEISVLVHGYKKFESMPWFDNQVQKMASVAAGIASATFTANSWRIWQNASKEFTGLFADSIKPAYFDARVFVIPEAEVCNYFLWRQQDATRNSVQMLARSLYSHKELECVGVNELKNMCADKGQPWDALPLRFQRGLCYYREPKTPYCTGGGCYEGCQHSPSADKQGTWRLDDAIPLFNQNRAYIDDLLKLDEQ